MLWLRPLIPEDFEALFQVSSDPLIWEQHPESNRYKREVFQRFFQAALDSKGAFIALNAGTNEVIGSSRFTALNPQENSIEIGYTFLARACWGRGYNAEMKKLMIDHAFEYVDRIFFYIGENNLRSRRSIEKVGAHLLKKVERQPQEGAKYFAAVYCLTRRGFGPPAPIPANHPKP